MIIIVNFSHHLWLVVFIEVVAIASLLSSPISRTYTRAHFNVNIFVHAQKLLETSNWFLKVFQAKEPLTSSVDLPWSRSFFRGDIDRWRTNVPSTSACEKKEWHNLWLNSLKNGFRKQRSNISSSLLSALRSPIQRILYFLAYGFNRKNRITALLFSLCFVFNLFYFISNFTISTFMRNAFCCFLYLFLCHNYTHYNEYLVWILL